ncbi:hypothetical protein C7271_07630 [filamentous cyanobacterium CCP5]|nr:hypothetical protein C7271_07630 [filamentous cyanobacterium CCP5]
MRILLVDDDEALMETLAESLIHQRYAVDMAADGETAQEFIALFAYDLIVLDILLPDVGGIALCQQLRQQGINCPILMLSAKDDSSHKVKALDAGADDYVVKPFDFSELCARIRALLRRDSPSAATVLEWGELTLDPNTFEVAYGDHQIHTTPKEYALLELFLRHPTRVFSLDAIIENLWSFEDPPGGDAVRTHIKGLRQKLKAGGAAKDLIETVYGLGYRLKPLESPAPLPHRPEAQPANSQEPEPTAAALAAAVTKAWESHQDTMEERLRVLEATAAALDGGDLGMDLRRDGRAQAHKLAGSLGCFGFSEGSRLARELEHLLQLDAPFEDQQVTQVSSLVERLRQNLEGGSRAPVEVAIAAVPQLLVVGAEAAFVQDLVTAAPEGMQVVAVADPVQALDHVRGPTAVLLWLAGADPESMVTTGRLADAISRRPAQVTVLLVTDSQDFHQRLQWVQQGVDRLLPPTASAAHVIEVVQQTLQVGQVAAKVVILDDDPQVLGLLRTILRPWGFQLTTLDDPTRLWSTLAAVQPDLLVLDVEMPEENGLELCQVLRADDRWRPLPILFLSVHEDASTQQQAFNLGADDFITKAAMATELPQRILNRLRRSQG